jgi:hypothetical protein
MTIASKVRKKDIYAEIRIPEFSFENMIVLAVTVSIDINEQKELKARLTVHINERN